MINLAIPKNNPLKPTTTMKARNLTAADERAILDNITEGYPVKLTQANGITRTISMTRNNGEEKYSLEVAGMTINSDNPDLALANLRRYKYTKIEF